MTLSDSQLLHKAHLAVVLASTDYERHADEVGRQALKKAEARWMALLTKLTSPPSAASHMVGESRTALDANAIEKHRKERARAFAQWELANKSYEGWGK